MKADQDSSSEEVWVMVMVQFSRLKPTGVVCDVKKSLKNHKMKNRVVGLGIENEKYFEIFTEKYLKAFYSYSL